MKKLYQEKLSTDVIFVVEGQQIKPHKCVVSAVSPYFAEMFSSKRIMLLEC